MSNRYDLIYKIEGGKYQIISCECGHQMIFPPPTEAELNEIYNANYYDIWNINKHFQQAFSLKLKTSQGFLKQSNALIPTSSNKHRHLDIGCAYGYMIEAAQLAGYESQGIEVSPAADVANKLGYNIQKVPLENTSFPDMCFDLITAVDVLEHILEPREWLKTCNRILKRGGVLLLVTPDCSSLAARILRAKWPHYKKEHIHYYSYRTLKRLLLSTGFNDISRKTGIKYMSINNIINHYETFQPNSIETKSLKLLNRFFFTKSLFRFFLPFPTGMVVRGGK